MSSFVLAEQAEADFHCGSMESFICWSVFGISAGFLGWSHYVDQLVLKVTDSHRRDSGPAAALPCL